MDGLREEHDIPKMTVQITHGEVTPTSTTNDILLDTGLYYFTATNFEHSTDELSFFLEGDLFPNIEPLRGVVSLPDSVDANGTYSETLESWVGAFDGEDIWDYLLEDAGELSLSVNAPEELTGTLLVELYVQNSNDEQYQRVHSFTIDASTASPNLIDNYLVTNNFYVRVGVRDKGKGDQNSDYSLSLNFATVDDDQLEDGEWLLAAGPEDIHLKGWVGYRNPTDTFLLTVNDGCAGRYDFKLSGDAQEATLNLRSISGKLLKSVTLDEQGEALFSNLELFTGDYLLEIDSHNDVWGENNTNYALDVSQKEAFEVISETESAEIQMAGKGEKVFFALDVPESGIYDVSELQNAGLTTWFQEGNNNGKLGPAKLRPDWVELQWDVPSYMTLCNNSASWGDAVIGLDAENHKFTFLSASSLG